MPSTTVQFRTATLSDAAAIGDVYLASRKQFLPYAPMPHADDQVRRWITEHLIPKSRVLVATEEGRVIGIMALTQRGSAGWIDHLYLDPASTGQGIGTRLLTLAKESLGSPVRLYTFQQNEAARRFYERHGFHAVQFSDGSGNEENCPDVLYEWRA